MDAANTNPPPRIDRFIGEYRFLSNFFPSAITSETGLAYASVEHAYQAAKASNEDDRLAIATARSPEKAKDRGSKLTLPPDWPSRKVEVMGSLLYLKFAPGTELATQLLATKDAELIEGNEWGDDFWGQCNGGGENHMGRLLMEVRTHLRTLSCPVEQ